MWGLRSRCGGSFCRPSTPWWRTRHFLSTAPEVRIRELKLPPDHNLQTHSTCTTHPRTRAREPFRRKKGGVLTKLSTSEARRACSWERPSASSISASTCAEGRALFFAVIWPRAGADGPWGHSSSSYTPPTRHNSGSQGGGALKWPPPAPSRVVWSRPSASCHSHTRAAAAALSWE